MTELRITVQDLYTVPSWTDRPGYCARGARAWFDAHGLDWAAFVRDGIQASTIEAIGDALALRVVEHARLRAGGHHG